MQAKYVRANASRRLSFNIQRRLHGKSWCRQPYPRNSTVGDEKETSGTMVRAHGGNPSANQMEGMIRLDGAVACVQFLSE